MPSVQNNSSEIQPPYTCSIDHEKMHDGKLIRARKKSCRTVWCPICFRHFKAKKLIERLREMEWEKVRHVILTIDRRPGTEFFSLGPEKTFNLIRKKKSVSQFIHNLKRTHSILITDFSWFLEWHGDGFPHWHVFIQVDKPGKLGMIQGDILRKAWIYGSVKETYVKNKKHWDNLTGYFQKAGYFEKGKAHQGVLPEWALKLKNIRRYDSMRKDRAEDDSENIKKGNIRIRESKLQKIEREINREQKKIDIGNITNETDIYEVILAKCGSMTEITILDCGIPIAGKLIPNTFKEMKEFIVSNGGSYSKEYGGYVVQLTEIGFNLFCALYL